MQNTPNPSVPLDELTAASSTRCSVTAPLTNQELAARCTSPPTCLRRVRRPVDGVIEKQVAIVAPAKVGSTLTAIVEITLDVRAAERLAEFEASLQRTNRQCCRLP